VGEGGIIGSFCLNPRLKRRKMPCRDINCETMDMFFTPGTITVRSYKRGVKKPMG
jgi:hypothetical protein